ncbi:MAG: universal stress protein [Gemmatimonadales bacterium]|nr:MAG: universal stress protein [Gemmatimonadales bacterium]
MFPSLLVPLDGSSFSEDALPAARRLARLLEARLHLVHVIRPAPDADLKSPQQDLEWKAQIREGAETYLDGLATELEEDGIRVTTAVLEGGVPLALDGYVKRSRIPLVVMTTHGSGGFRRWWLGSVADAILRKGSAHLLLVRPWNGAEGEGEGEVERDFHNVVVPLDGSAEAEAALFPARQLARRFGSSLSLVRVVPAPLELTSIYGVAGVRMEGEGHRRRKEEATEYLASVVARGGDPVPESHVAEASAAAEGVIQAAREMEGDLLVLSSHGRGGLSRMVLGSVADKIIRGTTLPVLVVRPPEDP